MKCPVCKLENPNMAQRCDCGFDFTTSTMRTHIEGAPLRKTVFYLWTWKAWGILGSFFVWWLIFTNIREPGLRSACWIVTLPFWLYFLIHCRVGRPPQHLR